MMILEICPNVEIKIKSVVAELKKKKKKVGQITMEHLKKGNVTLDNIRCLEK